MDGERMTDGEALRDVAAERAVVAAPLTRGYEAFLDTSDLVTRRTFTLEANQVVWDCLDHIFKGGHEGAVDYSTLMAAAHSIRLNHFFESTDEQHYLRALYMMGSLPVQGDTVRHLAEKIRKLEIARLLRSQLAAAQGDLNQLTGSEPIAHILGLAEQPIFDLTSLLTENGEGPTAFGEGVDAFLDHIEANPGQSVGIPTGYRNYDLAIGGGLRPGTVNMIAARAKQGKSLWAINVGLHVAGRLGLPVLYLDTEMNKNDQWPRVLANLSGVTINEIEAGDYTRQPFKRRKVREASTHLQGMPFDYLSIAGQPFEETLSVMRRWIRRRAGLNDAGKANPCLIVFDYVKLMSAEAMARNKQLAEYQLLGFMMTGLHNFMAKWGVPCLAFSQLNRENQVAASDRILWLCTNFSIFSRQDQAEMQEQEGERQYNRKLYVSHARHGPGMDEGDYINLTAYGSIARIVEGPRRNEMVANEAPPGRVVGEIDDDEPVVVPRAVGEADVAPGDVV